VPPSDRTISYIDRESVIRLKKPKCNFLVYLSARNGRRTYVVRRMTPRILSPANIYTTSISIYCYIAYRL